MNKINKQQQNTRKKTQQKTDGDIKKIGVESTGYLVDYYGFYSFEVLYYILVNARLIRHSAIKISTHQPTR